MLAATGAYPPQILQAAVLPRSAMYLPRNRPAAALDPRSLMLTLYHVTSYINKIVQFYPGKR